MGARQRRRERSSPSAIHTIAVRGQACAGPGWVLSSADGLGRLWTRAASVACRTAGQQPDDDAADAPAMNAPMLHEHTGIPFLMTQSDHVRTRTDGPCVPAHGWRLPGFTRHRPPMFHAQDVVIVGMKYRCHGGDDSVFSPSGCHAVADGGSRSARMVPPLVERDHGIASVFVSLSPLPVWPKRGVPQRSDAAAWGAWREAVVQAHRPGPMLPLPCGMI